MKQKGFTLIELLGVMIILSLLMIFAFPKIINQVKNSTNSTDEFTEKLIYNALDLYLEDNKDKYVKDSEINYCIPLSILVDEGYLKEPIKLSNSDSDITNLKTVEVSYDNDYNYELKDNSACTGSGFFFNGEVVYFDVSKGEKCTNYHSDNSTDGYNGIDNKNSNQTSCLKFNAFLDRGGYNVNLLLDHNTSLSNSNTVDSNALGPVTAIDSLKEDTKNWNGVETPDNYTYYSKAGVHKNKIDEFITASYDTIDYTIDYSNSKARLITANEVAKIAGVENFNETSNDSTVVDSNGELSLDGTYRVNLDTASFATTEPTNQWILATNNWYITSSAIHDTYGSFWTVTSSGTLNFGTYFYNGQLVDDFGIRPVIEVKRNKIS